MNNKTVRDIPDRKMYLWESSPVRRYGRRFRQERDRKTVEKLSL